MAKSVNLANRSFATKKAAVQHFRDILNRYESFTPISGDDLLDVSALLAAHPDAAEKAGVGIAHFFVHDSPDHPTRCFWVQRVDGSCIAFSYKTALGVK